MADIVAVVINVGTDLVATLALASLHQNAPGVPVRLINCDPSSTSHRHFEDLARKWDFEIVEQAARPHGQALDSLFRAQGQI